ncbi:defensin-like protein 1 [Pyrus ussuriensis x Pyrus communis]|uniref:Defensin-like protein 1 n=1 Tax=Pyrus ussuriensis x Pyrus communis TaxID=2448454 RepID=A0A5N5HAI4_9ROSA|nr:defensin-like protein 1 [Pyrus ussuriensis x Pyrus communis]
MERFMRLVSAAFVLILLLAATEMGPMGVKARSKSSKEVQERTCEAASGKFKGLCFSSTNCKNTCKREQFTGGKCRGFRRRCMCNKKC